MSKQLRKLLILVSEGASAAVRAVLVIVEGSALSSSVLLFFLLLNSALFVLLLIWVLVSTILTKSASPGFHPVVAWLPLLLQVGLLIRPVFCRRGLASRQVLTVILHLRDLSSHDLVECRLWGRGREFMISHLNWEEGLSLDKIRLV